MYVVTLALFLQLQQLQDLGYSGFSFGFFEEDVHFIGTADSTACSHPKVIQFLMALITASKTFYLTLMCPAIGIIKHLTALLCVSTKMFCR